MSRGPGRVMRAALAELAEYGHTEAWSVARRARHERTCGCGNQLCWQEDWRAPRPSRAELVAARRALRRLAERGDAELYRQRGDPYAAKPPNLCARLCVANAVNFPGRQHIAAQGAER